MSTRGNEAALAPEGPLGAPVRGPDALGDDPRRFWRLTHVLALTEFKLKFYGSVLGYLWQLVRPLLLFGVLYIVFTEFVRFGEGVEHYAVVLLLGVVLYTFVSEATSTAVGAVVERENLVRKIRFPRLVIPVSVVATATLNLLLNLLAVSVFMLVSGVEPRLSWLMMVPLLLLLEAFALGIAMMVSALYVRFRDVEPIWDVLLQVLFYATPILYPIEIVPSKQAQELLMLNPFGAIVQQVRHSIVDPSAPSAAEVAGGTEWLLVSGAILLLLVVGGFFIFKREAPRIAEEL